MGAFRTSGRDRLFHEDRTVFEINRCDLISIIQDWVLRENLMRNSLFFGKGDDFGKESNNTI